LLRICNARSIFDTPQGFATVGKKVGFVVTELEGDNMGGGEMDGADVMFVFEKQAVQHSIGQTTVGGTGGLAQSVSSTAKLTNLNAHSAAGTLPIKSLY